MYPADNIVKRYTDRTEQHVNTFNFLVDFLDTFVHFRKAGFTALFLDHSVDVSLTVEVLLQERPQPRILTELSKCHNNFSLQKICAIQK
jgi:hypothetical protein